MILRKPLDLRTKTVLMAIVPLVATFLLIASVVYVQEKSLARRERQLVEAAYMSAKQVELRNHVNLALSALQGLYRSSMDEEKAKREAMNLLATMNFGSDGYFYLYEMDGRNIMHPRQPELVGKNLWSMQDPAGKYVIRELIQASRNPHGGFVRYLWRKPSTAEITPKLGYVVSLERWNWMFGSGMYLDDIDKTLAQLDSQVKASITETLALIAGVAVLGLSLIGVCGIAMNLSQHRVAYQKLRLLAQQVVQSQEDERAHLSRDLHDGTSQTLMSIRLLLESAIERLKQGSALAALALLQKALARLGEASIELRRISHRLRPLMLDTLGLPAALKQLGEEMSHTSDVRVAIRLRGDQIDLPDEIKTVLFRVTQEALTNVAKHAKATAVELRLDFDPVELCLAIADNGTGFDIKSMQQHPNRGIGLKNMRERLATVGGRCTITSNEQGTEVIVSVPMNIIQREAVLA
jgi:two-component system, NarL family, sensor kinase